jgi:DnaK suppressor protein
LIDVFFKMMGFGAGKSLQSRAESSSASHPKSGITQHDPARRLSLEKGQAAAARRQELKSPAKKSKPVSKAKAVKPASKAVKAVSKVKAAAKPTSKSSAKPIAKKAASKTSIKPIAKPAAKKVAPKPAVKSKPIEKKANKAVSKPAAKPAPKATAKASATVKAKTPIQAKAKVTIKAPAKAATPAVSPSKAKQPVKATAKLAKPQPHPTSVKTDAPVKSPVKIAPVPVPAKPVASPAAPAKTKAGARVVPSYAPLPSDMSPHSGNTAAKASFTMSAPVLAPPPQVVIKKDPKLANNWKSKSSEQLTDAEVIAMPDSEYMNAKQLAFFRLKLVALKNGILSNAGETTEHLREDTSVVPDPADRATIEEEHALELRTRDRERKLLKKIEQSIASIDAEEYGYCDETGEPIGVARLIARPTATLSLEAQQRRELKQKMFGD